MALVTTKEMFEKAFQGGYAIGAFNINNMEIVQGVVAAAKAQNSAVILQVSKSALKYAHPKYLKAMVDAAVEEMCIRDRQKIFSMTLRKLSARNR